MVFKTTFLVKNPREKNQEKFMVIESKQEPSEKGKEVSIEDASIKELKETYHKFLRLYEHFAADRSVVNKQGEALGKIIDEIKAESSLAMELKVRLRQDLVETMKEAMEEINDQVKKSVQETITDSVSEPIKEFRSIVDSSPAPDSTNEKWSTQLWNIIILSSLVAVVVCTVYTAIMICRYIPGSYFTSDQVSTYRSGVFLDRLWSKLSKKERTRLMALENGEIPPEEKSFAWYAKQNPGMSSEDIRKKVEEQKE